MVLSTRSSDKQSWAYLLSFNHWQHYSRALSDLEALNVCSEVCEQVKLSYFSDKWEILVAHVDKRMRFTKLIVLTFAKGIN